MRPELPLGGVAAPQRPPVISGCPRSTDLWCSQADRWPVTDWYPVTESLCASASVRSRARGRRCAPGYVAGMVLEPEPVLVTDPTLTEVLDELW